MPIIRNTEQDSPTLREYFARIDAWGASEPGAQPRFKMNDLIDRIDATFVETTLFGLTSMTWLVIQAHDDYRSPWYITIGRDDQGYSIQYLLPAELRPWKNASVHGEARDLEEAMQYLVLAMEACGGWAGNAELQRLATQAKG